MSNESEHEPSWGKDVRPEGTYGMTRREALLQLLRVGGIAAGAAGAGLWLSGRSRRPVSASAQQARKDHRIASDQQWPALAVAQYAMDGRGAQPGEPRLLVQKALENLGGMGRFIARQDVVVI